MKHLSIKWQKTILWVTGYLNIIAFVIAGGYIHQKTEEETLRSSAKEVFLFTAIFTGISAFMSALQDLFALAETSQASLNKIIWFVNLLHIVVFAVFFLLDLFGIQIFKHEDPEPKKPEITESEVRESTESSDSI